MNAQYELDFSQMDITAKQNDIVRAHLLSGKSISPIEAWEKYGIYRIGARIFDLRDNGRGMPIRTEMVKTPEGKRFAKYSLEAA